MNSFVRAALNVDVAGTLAGPVVRDGKRLDCQAAPILGREQQDPKEARDSLNHRRPNVSPRQVGGKVFVLHVDQFALPRLEKAR